MLRPNLPVVMALAAASALQGAEVRIRVTAKGAPVPDVRIQATRPDGQIRILTTSKEGITVIDGVPGTTLVIERAGFAPLHEVLAAGLGELDLRLEPSVLQGEVEVVATQSRVPMAEVASAVTVVEGEVLQEVLATSSNLADALGKVVPGLAPGTGSASIWGQTLRGRGMQVLVDGIPMTTLRNTARDLAAIDPNQVERVEVLRGTSSMYGDGATGGLVNIITRSASASGKRYETSLRLEAFPGGRADSGGGRLSQLASGRQGRLDWLADVAIEQIGLSYDGEGDRIQPDPYGQGGLADTQTRSLLGKLGWRFGEDQRLQVALNRLDSEQDTEWTTDPSVNTLPALSVKSRPIRGLSMDHPQGSTNRLLQVSWEDRSFGRSMLRAQFYARDYQTVFTPFDGRAVAAYGRQIFQSRLESESLGARLDVETPLPAARMRLFWGLDAGRERTEQPVWIMDPTVYDQSGGRIFRTIDDRPWVPEVDKRNQAAFVQVEWLAAERWQVRAGLRHDRVQAGIPGFTTLAGNTIQGGERRWNGTLVNASLVYHAGSFSRTWASFSQGFSLPDIGLVLRSAPAGASLETLPFQPQVVDAWEVGWATERQDWSLNVAAFYNTSEFGTSSAGFNQPVVRAPERVYGAEVALNLALGSRAEAGLTAAWSEGKFDPDQDGDYTWLNNFRIAAPSATLWASHRTTDRWTNRIQALWSGARDRFGSSTAFGQRPIESFAVVDAVSSLATRWGRFELGIQNLLDKAYFVRDAQLLRSGFNNSHTMAPGRSARLTWSIRY